MPFSFANKLEEFLSEPFPPATGLINPFDTQFTDRACELLDEVELLAKTLFVKKGSIDRRHESALLSRGFTVRQELVRGKHRIVIKTIKGELHF